MGERATSDRRRGGGSRRLGWVGWLAIAVAALLLAATVWLLRTRVPSSFAPESEVESHELAPLGSYELFFGDPRATGLRREVRLLEKSGELEDDARVAIEALIAGSLEGGISPWPRGATLEELFVSTTGIAYVNFNRAVRESSPPGDYIEWLLAATITRTLGANFPEITGVRILIDDESTGNLIRCIPLDWTLTAPMFMEAP